MRFGKKFITAMFIFLILFVITVLIVFVKVGSEPAVLIGSVFSICGIQGGILGKMKIDERKCKKGGE